LRFEKVIPKSLVASFFGTRCMYRPIGYDQPPSKRWPAWWLIIAYTYRDKTLLANHQSSHIGYAITITKNKL